MTTSVTSGQNLIDSDFQFGQLLVGPFGTDTVVSGGFVFSTIVGGTSSFEIVNGGFADGTTVNGGGTQIVEVGGSSLATLIFSSGSELVSSGGVAASTTVAQNLASMTVASGGAASATILKSGGQLLASGITVGTYVSSGSVEEIISGGTATVTDGTTTVQLHLIGTYTVGSFHTSVDGTGGTIITDPPVSSGSGVAPSH